jgi:hypothetical protein
MIAAFQAAERGSIPRYCIPINLNSSATHLFQEFVDDHSGYDRQREPMATHELEHGSTARFLSSDHGGRKNFVHNANWQIIEHAACTYAKGPRGVVQ